MKFFSHFHHPGDPRWSSGLPRTHHIAILWKNIFLIPFIILVIVEAILFHKWWRDSGYNPNVDYSPWAFGMRIALSLVPDLVYTLILTFFILNFPARWTTWRLHPVFALVCSIVMIGFYVTALLFNILIVGSNEVFFDNNGSWYVLGAFEAVLQGLGLGFWLWCMVAASVSVDRWRKGNANVLIVGPPEYVHMAIYGHAGVKQGGEDGRA